MDAKLIGAHRCMVVDDDDLILEIVTMTLLNLGVRTVKTVTSAPDGLRAIRANPGVVDLLLCDLQMPEMDGIEFLRHLAATNYRGNIILMSGESQRILDTAREVGRARSLQVIGTLRKPLEPPMLRELLVESVKASATEASAVAPIAIYAQDLERAFEQSQFVNYYQPKVCIADRRPLSVEALVRWQHPEYGLLVPGQFISTLENLGYMERLTRTVMEQGMRDLRGWKNCGLRIAINVSCQELGDTGMVDEYLALVAKCGLQPGEVILEVTEDRFINDLANSLEVLGRFCLRGFSLALDDFGTGSATVEQLRRAPFSELKIDQSFVTGAWANKESCALLESMVTLGRQLDLDVVVEGVECRSDWNLVEALGCHVAQGYYIARPMPAGVFAQWLSDPGDPGTQSLQHARAAG